MTKQLRMSFTGSIVLTPEYDDKLTPIDHSLSAVIPGGRHRRPSPRSPNRQVNSQFAFLVFPYAQLVQTAADARDADYKYPDQSSATKGVCFLEREDWAVATPSLDRNLTFDPSPAVGSPTKSSTGARWIPRWSKFSYGKGTLDQTVLDGEGDYVRVTIPAGMVSAGFVAEGAAWIDFDYGEFPPDPRQYAQEIVVTLTFNDETPSVTLRSKPFSDPAARPADPSTLTFAWYDNPTIDLLFGNGTLESLLNVLPPDSFAGQDHQGDYDTDFAVLYDVMKMKKDSAGRLPMPRIKSFEILKVPCVSTMAPTSSGALAVRRSRKSGRTR